MFLKTLITFNSGKQQQHVRKIEPAISKNCLKQGDGSNKFIELIAIASHTVGCVQATSKMARAEFKSRPEKRRKSSTLPIQYTQFNKNNKSTTSNNNNKNCKPHLSAISKLIRATCQIIYLSILLQRPNAATSNINSVWLTELRDYTTTEPQLGSSSISNINTHNTQPSANDNNNDNKFNSRSGQWFQQQHSSNSNQFQSQLQALSSSLKPSIVALDNAVHAVGGSNNFRRSDSDSVAPGVAEAPTTTTTTTSEEANSFLANLFGARINNQSNSSSVQTKQQQPNSTTNEADNNLWSFNNGTTNNQVQFDEEHLATGGGVNSGNALGTKVTSTQRKQSQENNNSTQHDSQWPPSTNTITDLAQPGDDEIDFNGSPQVAQQQQQQGKTKQHHYGLTNFNFTSSQQQPPLVVSSFDEYIGGNQNNNNNKLPIDYQHYTTNNSNSNLNLNLNNINSTQKPPSYIYYLQDGDKWNFQREQQQQPSSSFFGANSALQVDSINSPGGGSNQADYFVAGQPLTYLSSQAQAQSQSQHNSANGNGSRRKIHSAGTQYDLRERDRVVPGRDYNHVSLTSPKLNPTLRQNPGIDENNLNRQPAAFNTIIDIDDPQQQHQQQRGHLQPPDYYFSSNFGGNSRNPVVTKNVQTNKAADNIYATNNKQLTTPLPFYVAASNLQPPASFNLVPRMIPQQQQQQHQQHLSAAQQQANLLENRILTQFVGRHHSPFISPQNRPNRRHNYNHHQHLHGGGVGGGKQRQDLILPPQTIIQHRPVRVVGGENKSSKLFGSIDHTQRGGGSSSFLPSVFGGYITKPPKTSTRKKNLLGALGSKLLGGGGGDSTYLLNGESSLESSFYSTAEKSGNSIGARGRTRPKRPRGGQLSAGGGVRWRGIENNYNYLLSPDPTTGGAGTAFLRPPLTAYYPPLAAFDQSGSGVNQHQQQYLHTLPAAGIIQQPTVAPAPSSLNRFYLSTTGAPGVNTDFYPSLPKLPSPIVDSHLTQSSHHLSHYVSKGANQGSGIDKQRQAAASFIPVVAVSVTKTSPAPRPMQQQQVDEEQGNELNQVDNSNSAELDEYLEMKTGGRNRMRGESNGDYGNLASGSVARDSSSSSSSSPRQQQQHQQYSRQFLNLGAPQEHTTTVKSAVFGYLPHQAEGPMMQAISHLLPTAQYHHSPKGPPTQVQDSSQSNYMVAANGMDTNNLDEPPMSLALQLQANNLIQNDIAHPFYESNNGNAYKSSSMRHPMIGIYPTNQHQFHGFQFLPTAAAAAAAPHQLLQAAASEMNPLLQGNGAGQPTAFMFANPMQNSEISEESSSSSSSQENSSNDENSSDQLDDSSNESSNESMQKGSSQQQQLNSKGNKKRSSDFFANAGQLLLSALPLLLAPTLGLMFASSPNPVVARYHGPNPFSSSSAGSTNSTAASSSSSSSSSAPHSLVSMPGNYINGLSQPALPPSTNLFSPKLPGYITSSSSTSSNSGLLGALSTSRPHSARPATGGGELPGHYHSGSDQLTQTTFAPYSSGAGAGGGGRKRNHSSAPTILINPSADGGLTTLGPPPFSSSVNETTEAANDSVSSLLGPNSNATSFVDHLSGNTIILIAQPDSDEQHQGVDAQINATAAAAEAAASKLKHHYDVGYEGVDFDAQFASLKKSNALRKQQQLQQQQQQQSEQNSMAAAAANNNNSHQGLIRAAQRVRPPPPPQAAKELIGSSSKNQYQYSEVITTTTSTEPPPPPPSSVALNLGGSRQTNNNSIVGQQQLQLQQQQSAKTHTNEVLDDASRLYPLSTWPPMRRKTVSLVTSNGNKTLLDASDRYQSSSSNSKENTTKLVSNGTNSRLKNYTLTFSDFDDAASGGSLLLPVVNKQRNITTTNDQVDFVLSDGDLDQSASDSSWSTMTRVNLVKKKTRRKREIGQREKTNDKKVETKEKRENKVNDGIKNHNTTTGLLMMSEESSGRSSIEQEEDIINSTKRFGDETEPLKRDAPMKAKQSAHIITTMIANVGTDDSTTTNDTLDSPELTGDNEQLNSLINGGGGENEDYTSGDQTTQFELRNQMLRKKIILDKIASGSSTFDHQVGHQVVDQRHPDDLMSYGRQPPTANYEHYYTPSGGSINRRANVRLQSSLPPPIEVTSTKIKLYTNGSLPKVMTSSANRNGHGIKKNGLVLAEDTKKALANFGTLLIKDTLQIPPQQPAARVKKYSSMRNPKYSSNSEVYYARYPPREADRYDTYESSATEQSYTRTTAFPEPASSGVGYGGHEHANNQVGSGNVMFYQQQQQQQQQGVNNNNRLLARQPGQLNTNYLRAAEQSDQQQPDMFVNPRMNDRVNLFDPDQNQYSNSQLDSDPSFESSSGLYQQQNGHQTHYMPDRYGGTDGGSVSSRYNQQIGGHYNVLNRTTHSSGSFNQGVGVGEMPSAGNFSGGGGGSTEQAVGYNSSDRRNELLPSSPYYNYQTSSFNPNAYYPTSGVHYGGQPPLANRLQGGYLSELANGARGDGHYHSIQSSMQRQQPGFLSSQQQQQPSNQYSSSSSFNATATYGNGNGSGSGGYHNHKLAPPPSQPSSSSSSYNHQSQQMNYNHHAADDYSSPPSYGGYNQQHHHNHQANVVGYLGGSGRLDQQHLSGGSQSSQFHGSQKYSSTYPPSSSDQIQRHPSDRRGVESSQVVGGLPPLQLAPPSDYYGTREREKNRQQFQSDYSLQPLLAPPNNNNNNNNQLLSIHSGDNTNQFNSALASDKTDSRAVNEYLKRVQFSDSDRDKLMASYLTCDGLLNDNDHCLERLSCEFSDPQNIEKANKLDRAVSSILLGHILINTYIPNQFKLRLKSASLYGYTQSGKCSRFACNKLAKPSSTTTQSTVAS